MANSQYILIQWSDAPGILPPSFTEKLYLGNNRVEHIGVHKEIVSVGEKLATTYNSLARDRIIQALMFDKYRIKFLRKESHVIETLEIADIKTIYDYATLKTFHPIILDISSEQAEGSYQLVTIEFYDVNVDNYYNSYPVVNHLRSDTLTVRYSDNVLTKIVLTPSNYSGWTIPYTYYSPFIAKLFTPQPEINANSELEGVQINTRVAINQQAQIVFFLNNADLAEFKYYSMLCNAYNAYIQIKSYDSGYTIYTSQQLPQISDEQVSGGIDLYKVTLTIIYNTDDNLTYSQ